MFVMSPKALSVEQAETYYAEKYSQDDYYTQGERVAGEWFGKGALALGLSGQARPEDFHALLRGLDPRTGGEIVPAARFNGAHRAGWDGVFSAPKSVSIQALAGGDNRLIDAHRAAVNTALGELEQFALSRQHAGKQWVVSANVVAARFDHIAARPAEGAPDGQGPDPQLHTHVVFLNLTRRPDGAYRALDPLEIYRSQAFATAVYRAELARAVQDLGYGIEVTGVDGRWELKGFSRAQVMAFSLRRQDIESRIGELGIDGAKAAQLIALSTRRPKQAQDERELKNEWRERAAALGIPLDATARQALKSGPVRHSDLKVELEAALAYSVEHHTEREAVVDRRELEATALKQAMGKAVLAEIRAHAGVAMPNLIPLEGDFVHPQGVFTTTEMAALERENLDLMREEQGRAEPIAGADEIARWAAKRRLAADQARAAEVTLSTSDWLSAIEGRAGAAKTTTMGAIREFAEERRYTVRGFGPTSASVKALNEAGVPARTVASLLENPLPERRGPELWIVDESSLIATRPVNRLLHLAKEARIERVVFVGDHRQHHAIEAGRPVYQMERAGMATARLQVIRRQRDLKLKRVVELAAAGAGAQAAHALFDQGRVTAIAEVAERCRAIAANYLRSHEAGQRVLVVSPANEERRELNRVIRELMVQRGHVAKASLEHAILVNRDLTRAERARARNYQVGEVVRFSRGSPKLGLQRGGYVTVEATDPERNLITGITSSGARVTYRANQFRGVEVFRVERRALAAGDRIQFRALDRALRVPNGEFATVIAITPEQLRLRTDNGRELAAARARLKHIDYGYASTSHSSQGATVDRVLVNIDSARSAKLVNQRQFYVSISRARLDAHLYTDDAGALARVIGREQLKPTALEALSGVRRPATRRYRPFSQTEPLAVRLTQKLTQTRKITQGTGIKW